MNFKFKKIISLCVLILVLVQNSYSTLPKEIWFYKTHPYNGHLCEVDELTLPSAFSPNNDGENDLFCLEGWETCVDTFEIFIFNRWGEVVYESHLPNFCWDGIYKGKYLESNVFVYVLKAKTKEGIEFKKSGNITLLR